MEWEKYPEPLSMTTAGREAAGSIRNSENLLKIGNGSVRVQFRSNRKIWAEDHGLEEDEEDFDPKWKEWVNGKFGR
jgi:hypothetical protein